MSLKSLFQKVIFLFLFLASSPVYAADTVLIIRIEGVDFDHAVQGLTEELDEEFSIEQLIVDKKTTYDAVERKIKSSSPRLVILMDNISISLYKKYQETLAASAEMIPSVSLMASFMDYAVRNLKNAAGVFYEVPLVTSIVSLRSILPSESFDRVGVVHRSFMRSSVSRNRGYCRKEGITLIAHEIPNKGDAVSNLKKGLAALKAQDIDALWVPNDSRLINGKLLKKVWLPFTAKFKKPVIAGVEILVKPSLKFGTFAVIPDHIQLGGQGAEMVFDIMENDWKTDEIRIEPPRSVYKILNLKQVRKRFSADKDQIQNVVDKVLE